MLCCRIDELSGRTPPKRLLGTRGTTATAAAAGSLQSPRGCGAGDNPESALKRMRLISDVLAGPSTFGLSTGMSPSAMRTCAELSREFGQKNKSN